ncbi:MAG: DUF1080 domain-containing protein [Verrucomicrobia bacterium]|nr:DUF1080 domain-containing protein [Verrucomicrobiota bacterium]
MKTNSLLLCLTLVAALSANAADAKKKDAKKGDGHAAVGYTDTPMLPGGKWHVHDPDRPQPRVVEPAKEVGQPPGDAVVLFDGKDLSNWRDAKGNPSGWIVEHGYMQVPPRGTTGGGDIFSKQEFGDCQLHVEFATPNPPEGDSQGRGNSGVFLLGLYEFQVLDSYNNRTYADGTAAALYGQMPPLVNPVRPPGEWQTYDIIFTAPRFGADGKVSQPAIVTALRNGVLVQNHEAYLGPSGHRNLASYDKTKATAGPIKFQDHGNPMRFRNVWIRPLPETDRN